MGTVRKLVKLAIVLLIVNALYRFVPPYLRYQQFKDDVRQLALFSKGAPDGALVERVLALAEQDGVPVERDDIDVRHDTANIYIDVSWIQTIDFAPFYSYPWQFDVNAHAISNIVAPR